MPESSLLTLRLDPKLKKQLDRLSRSMNRSRSSVAAEAIREYVSLNDWQITEIKKGIAEADRGDFAGDKEVERRVKKMDQSCGLSGSA
jgi:RHH-type transcriptional regulator, rel operon repressor / antitoxin RelB